LCEGFGGKRDGKRPQGKSWLILIILINLTEEGDEDIEQFRNPVICKGRGFM